VLALLCGLVCGLVFTIFAPFFDDLQYFDLPN